MERVYDIFLCAVPSATSNRGIATSNKGITTSSKGLTTSSKDATRFCSKCFWMFWIKDDCWL